MAFKILRQYDTMDCGPTCLQMVARHYGKSYSLQRLRDESGISREGVSLLGISKAAEKIGFQTLGARLSYEQLVREAPLPCIVHWKQSHFVIVYKVKERKVYVADPAEGSVIYERSDFLSNWIGFNGQQVKEGFALLLEPTDDFYKEPDEVEVKASMKSLFSHFFVYKRLILQLFLAVAAGSLLQLALPLLTQSIVDVGVNNKNLNFILLVLIAQIMLFVGRASIDFIRSWIMLHVSSRVNVTILSNFLFKLLKLPMGFFDTKVSGDILQRVNDHSRIEHFLTGSASHTLFSLLNLVLFSVVLCLYSGMIFLVFAVGSLLYVGWVVLFLNKRKSLDSKHFGLMSRNQDSIIQLIRGMHEIKLNNCESQKRWEWEKIQARLFKLNMKILSIGQYQTAGGAFLNEGKNILITYLAATSVVEGKITLGAMLAIQYIIGQLNSPIEQFTQFMLAYQEAKLSLGRLTEIDHLQPEEPPGKELITQIAKGKDIVIEGLSFAYPAPRPRFVLNDINMVIPYGKTTAIVGTSGSGKTTLLKLLLKFYEPGEGIIKYGNANLGSISNQQWRSHCGVVMQDGYIFSDSVAKNIALGADSLDAAKMTHAVEVANIKDVIENLPLAYNTKLGADGNGLSQGQKQRILIARSVYKDPDFIFFDEATNALDANNELVIMRNLAEFFEGRTVVVVAHRLSTVKNAHNIVVLHQGNIVEQGNHEELIRLRGAYYNLVRNQLELGAE
jgi:ATP-binding cassette subfamily B protein